MIHLRCKPRSACGDFFVFVRFATAREALAALGALQNADQSKSVPLPKVIRAGTQVSLLLQGHKMILRLVVKALNSGAIGESIRVRDEETRRIYLAVVSGPLEAKGAL